MYVLFQISFFRLYSGFKMSFGHKSFCRSLFLSAARCWADRVFSIEMDQKVNFDRTIGCVDLYLDFKIHHFEVFRLYENLNDAAGAVRSHGDEGPGYSYKIGWGSKSCLLGHVTGLLFCLYVKFFLAFLFNPVGF